MPSEERVVVLQFIEIKQFFSGATLSSFLMDEGTEYPQNIRQVPSHLRMFGRPISLWDNYVFCLNSNSYVDTSRFTPSMIKSTEIAEGTFSEKLGIILQLYSMN